MRYEEASVSVVMALAGLPISNPVIIVVAGLVLALVVAIAAVFLLRSGKGKGAKAGAAGGGSGWQPQQNPQAGAPGAGGWNQGGAPQQQQPGGWGMQDNAQQGWGAPQQQQPGGWGTSTPQPVGNQWSAPAQGSPGAGQQQGWGAASAQPANAWGTGQSSGPNQWDQGQGANQWNNAAAPAQDQWAQPQQQPASPAAPWGGAVSQPQTPQGGQVPPTAYAGGSGPSWGQPAYSTNPAQSDQWAADPVPAAGGGAPTWQQPGSSFGPPDSDKTILRTVGPQPQPQMGQGALGIIRVEAGKEPGREYEVRKPSLSIGRSRESDIFLEDLAVSRLHATIVNKGGGAYELKDEGSANGTKLNGQQVNKYQSLSLNEGDRIQLGQTVLVFARR